MSETVLHIKNMVCPRCINAVKKECEKLNIPVKHVELGRVITDATINEQKLQMLTRVLEDNGFELIGDKRTKLIESIKTIIIQKIHHSEDLLSNINSSDYITGKLGYDYSYLSHLFSSVEGITIEKYIIHQKIEKVKELLVYNELTLNEISYRLGYSSVQHLSSQFKKVTGLTPSHFKTLKENKRKPLDSI